MPVLLMLNGTLDANCTGSACAKTGTTGQKYKCDSTNACVADVNGTLDANCTGSACAKTGGGTTASVNLYNPLPTGDLIQMFLVITQAFLAIVAIVAVLFIIVGGFLMTTAGGNEEMYAKGRKTITWAILGLIIATLSFSIIAIVMNILRANVNAVS